MNNRSHSLHKKEERRHSLLGRVLVMGSFGLLPPSFSPWPRRRYASSREKSVVAKGIRKVVKVDMGDVALADELVGVGNEPARQIVCCILDCRKTRNILDGN